MFENVLFSEASTIQLLNTEDAIVDGLFPASPNLIPVAGFHRFGFLILAGALDSALTCQVHQDKGATTTASQKDITGAVVVVPALGDDKWYLVECDVDQLDSNNDFTHVTLDITGAAGGNDYAAVVFLAWGKDMPATQGATKGAIVSLAG